MRHSSANHIAVFPVSGTLEVSQVSVTEMVFFTELYNSESEYLKK